MLIERPCVVVFDVMLQKDQAIGAYVSVMT